VPNNTSLESVCGLNSDMLGFILVLTTVLSSVNCNRVSLFTAGSKYLRFNPSNGQSITLSAFNNTNSDIYETSWDLQIQPDGSFALSPILQPNISVKAIQDGIELGTGTKETSWILIPSGNSEFKIESKQFSGFYFGLEKKTLALTRTNKNILTFQFTETKIPATLLYLATDMTAFDKNQVFLISCQ